MRDDWPQHYILVDKTPIAVDMMTWAEWFQYNDRTVALTEINDKVRVSTVFLGLDHRYFGPGDPLLFESMVFGGPNADDMRRYTTWAAAERGHEELVAETRKAVARIEALKARAEAKK